jgi:hypothetical protein
MMLSFPNCRERKMETTKGIAFKKARTLYSCLMSTQADRAV